MDIEESNNEAQSTSQIWFDMNILNCISELKVMEVNPLVGDEVKAASLELIKKLGG